MYFFEYFFFNIIFFQMVIVTISFESLVYFSQFLLYMVPRINLNKI